MSRPRGADRTAGQRLRPSFPRGWNVTASRSRRAKCPDYGGVASGCGLTSCGRGGASIAHAFSIGFVFSAIIAHEPIIAPAVTGLRFAYTPLLYAPLVLLDGALVLRISADLLEDNELRRWTGMIQAVAIVLFLLLSAGSVAAGRRHRDAAAGGRIASPAAGEPRRP